MSSWVNLKPLKPGMYVITRTGYSVWGGLNVYEFRWLPSNADVLILSDLVFLTNLHGYKHAVHRCLTSIGVVHMTPNQLSGTKIICEFT